VGFHPPHIQSTSYSLVVTSLISQIIIKNRVIISYICWQCKQQSQLRSPAAFEMSWTLNVFHIFSQNQNINCPQKFKLRNRNKHSISIPLSLQVLPSLIGLIQYDKEMTYKLQWKNWVFYNNSQISCWDILVKGWLTVDPPMGPICSAPLFLCLVHLNVRYI